MEGFKEFIHLYVENDDLPDVMVRRLFLSFVKKTKNPLLGFGPNSGPMFVPAVAATAATASTGLFSQSSSTITGAIHSLGSRFNFSGLTGVGTNSLNKPAPSQSVPEGTKLLCTVRK